MKGYQTTGIFEVICCYIRQFANHRYIVVRIDYLEGVQKRMDVGNFLKIIFENHLLTSESRVVLYFSLQIICSNIHILDFVKVDFSYMNRLNGNSE